MQKSDFIVVGLQEHGVLKIGSHVHGSFIGNEVVMAASPGFVGAEIGWASERHAMMFLFLLLTLLWSDRRGGFVIVFFFNHVLPIVVTSIKWRFIVGVINDVVAVCDVIVNAGLVGIDRVMLFVVVILVICSRLVVWSVLVFVCPWMPVVV